MVWIVNEGGHDYSAASNFGHLVPLTEGSINTFNVDRTMVLLRNKIVLAQPQDYLLISGPQLLNAVVLAMWLERFDTVNVLQWSARRQLYVPILVSNAAVKRNANWQLKDYGVEHDGE